VDASGTVGNFPSLAFDPVDGNPAIAYFNDNNDSLKLAWHDGSIWQTQMVDGFGLGVVPSLAFNDFGSGFPSIAYYDGGAGGSGSLYYIEDPPGPVPEPTSVTLLMAGALLLSVSPSLSRSAHLHVNHHEL
jgi:hypothetical protein